MPAQRLAGMQHAQAAGPHLVPGMSSSICTLSTEARRLLALPLGPSPAAYCTCTPRAAAAISSSGLWSTMLTCVQVSLTSQFTGVSIWHGACVPPSAESACMSSSVQALLDVTQDGVRGASGREGAHLHGADVNAHIKGVPAALLCCQAC